jgi:hypothetical protein
VIERFRVTNNLPGAQSVAATFTTGHFLPGGACETRQEGAARFSNNVRA